LNICGIQAKQLIIKITDHVVLRESEATNTLHDFASVNQKKKEKDEKTIKEYNTRRDVPVLREPTQQNLSVNIVPGLTNDQTDLHLPLH
jgi:hypothetical protein